MAKSIMIQGTMSNAGKSLIAAGLCRIFAQDGYRVAPFKSQNMALNSYITRDGLEMGRAQVVQAEAAGIEPDARMNPILLKPTTDVGSQVIVCGRPVGNMTAAQYYKKKKDYVSDIMRAYDSLAAENDIIVIEGAGSPAEINLKQEDIVNMGMARLADAPVLLVGDIDRGGVFAQLYGTVSLLEEDEKARIKGLIINKFRGDRAILEPGLKTLEQLCGVPVAGVVPYIHVDIEDEDSLSGRLAENKVRKLIDIAVIRLPRISNFTDFDVFERYENVSVRYVTSVSQLGAPDMVILPGTKSTIADLLWLRQSGLENAVLKAAAAGTPVFGICGGYQMLGSRIFDPDHTESASSSEIRGLGLLDTETVFYEEKTQTRSRGTVGAVSGIFAGLSGKAYDGYEIHMGRGDEKTPILKENGNVYGTYVHGFFDTEEICGAVLKALCSEKGVDFEKLSKFDFSEYKQKQYDALADGLRESLDMDFVYKITGLSR
ncbi:MAG: cobyric acid synthase [Lachnospiraceae bacterium]|nr:cobyric acid synthase [Lachnospiraceae bacterium]